MATVTKVYNRSNTQYDLADASARSTISGYPTKAQIINYFYPVGSIYISTSSTNPSTTMTGTTWERIQDRMLLGASGSYSAGSTGGSATHTLTTGEMASHNHSFTGTAKTTEGISANHTHNATTGNQSANHTHSGTSGNPSANHTHTTANHTHVIKGDPSTGYYSKYESGGKTNSPSNTQGSVLAGTGTTGTVSAWHTHTTSFGNQSQGHTHSLTTGGISANHTHSITAGGTVGNTGSGTAFSILPPYLAVYVWKRTA